MDTLIKQLLAFNDIEDKLSYLCNVSALLKQSFLDTNWVGFYLYKNHELHLGPFQGKVACTIIPLDKGVCGAAFSKKMLLNVADVHRFEGHISCDSDSCSEIVIPLIYQNKCLGVLDIDSASYGRFNYKDEEVLEKIAQIIAKKMCEN